MRKACKRAAPEGGCERGQQRGGLAELLQSLQEIQHVFVSGVRFEAGALSRRAQRWFYNGFGFSATGDWKGGGRDRKSGEAGAGVYPGGL